MRLSELTTKISMKVGPYYGADIRGGSLGWGASNDSEVVDNGSFQRLRWLFHRKL